MSFVATIGSTSVTVLDGFDPGFPELTDRGRTRVEAGLPVGDGDYTNRTMTFTVFLQGSSLSNRATLYRALMAELLPSPSSTANTNTFTFNAGSGNNLTATFYRGLSTGRAQMEVAGQSNFTMKVDVELVCQPFFRGAAVDLPRNYVKDSKMWEDFDGDGICNSFTNDDSGTPPTHTNSIDSGQKIAVTATGAAARYAGLTQTMTDIDAAEVWSYSIEYKCDAATNCQYDIYLSYTGAAGGTEDYLLEARTAVQADWTQVTLENQTIPASATAAVLTIRVTSTDAGGSGALWVRKALAIQDDAIPTGKASAKMWWESEVAELPSMFQIDSVPGDVEAEARIKCSAVNITRFYLGQCSFSDDAIVLNPVNGTGTVVAGTHGGEVQRVTLDANPKTTLTGQSHYTLFQDNYLVIVKMRSGAATPTGDTLTFKLWESSLSTVDSSALTLYTAQDVWGVYVVGVFGIPAKLETISSITAWSSQHTLSYAGDSSSANWDIDYVSFIPASRMVSAISATTYDGTIVIDSIADKPGIHHQTTVPYSGTPTSNQAEVWPYTTTGNPFMLLPGNNIFNLLTYDNTSEATITTDALMEVRYVPRYLLTE